MNRHASVSIIIVNYNTKELLDACLASLVRSHTGSTLWQIIVVDNGSTDGSVASLSTGSKQQINPYISLTVIKNTDNVGFAKANNMGLGVATGTYILLLNSDTEVNKGTINAMVRFMEKNKDIGAATCRLHLPDGTMDPACHRGFPTPLAAFTYFIGLEKIFPQSRVFAQYHLGYKDIKTVHEIDCPTGAFFLTKRSVIDTVGKLDEDYFMYGEDIDWAFRIKQKGWKIMFNPSVSALHRKKQSGRSHASASVRRKTMEYFYDAMRIFYRKHYENTYPKLLTTPILLFLSFRIFILRVLCI